jgi:hypothetical protein
MVRRKLTARRRGLKYKNASYINKSRLSTLILITESHPICSFPTRHIRLKQHAEILKKTSSQPQTTWREW